MYETRNGFDSHWSKYQNPLAALTERWILDGDYGDHEWADNGEGSILWVGRATLTWEDARYLMGDDFTMTAAELDDLARELGMAQGILHSWDDRGFVYAQTFTTFDAVHATAEAIDVINAGLAALEDGAE